MSRGWLEPVFPTQHWDQRQPIRETSNEKQRFDHEVRMARFVWVHEIAHTVYAAFDAPTAATWRSIASWAPGHNGEAPATKYAREGVPRLEEDFCESFAIFALYPDKLRDRCPQRWQWFKAREGLLGLRAPLEHPGPFVADVRQRWEKSGVAQYLPPAAQSPAPALPPGAK